MTVKTQDDVAALRERIAELEAWQVRACYLLGHADPRLKGEHTNAIIELVNELANEKWREAAQRESD